MLMNKHKYDMTNIVVVPFDPRISLEMLQKFTEVHREDVVIYVGTEKKETYNNILGSLQISISFLKAKSTCWSPLPSRVSDPSANYWDPVVPPEMILWFQQQ